MEENRPNSRLLSLLIFTNSNYQPSLTYTTQSHMETEVFVIVKEYWLSNFSVSHKIAYNRVLGDEGGLN